MKTTAITTLYSKEENPDNEQTALFFNADYADPRNREWARFTPALSLGMTVLNSVAENFESGKRYLLTFEEADTA